MKKLLISLVGASLFLTTGGSAAESFPVSIAIDASRPEGELKPIWRFFGADEPNYATMKDGRKLLGELGELSKGNVYYRAHSLLCTGDGTAALKWGSTNMYTEDAAGNPIYDWKIIDEIFDTYLKNGIRPYAQIGFMPKALSTHPDPYQHHWKPGDPYEEIGTGWSYPPKDYNKWSELCYQWVKHSVERYGKEEVEKWYWEVWNEPNGKAYWKGTVEEFCKLHDYAIAGVKRALPTAKVGGPDTAGYGKFTDKFIEHVLRGTNYATGEKGTPFDFVAYHAKGAPTVVDGHVRMGISTHLRNIDEGFKRLANYPELKNMPIILGESDPDGCAACSAEQYPSNNYRNGSLFASYTAACFAREHELAALRGANLEGAVTWAFEFENTPWFAGFRVLATNGVTLPVMNVFRMMAKMPGERIAATSDHQVSLDDMLKSGVRNAPDVGVLASRDKDQIVAMIWHYHDDAVDGADAKVTLKLNNIDSGKWKMQQFRIDENHSNAFTMWKAMDSPAKPDADQIASLEAAGKLSEFESSKMVEVSASGYESQFDLPRQGVALIVLSR